MRLLLAAAVPLLLAARGYVAAPVGNVIMAPEPPLDPAAEITVAPGGAIFEQAVFAGPGGILTEPVMLTIAGVAGEFAAGTVLQQMTLTGQASSNLISVARVYCARPSDAPSAAATTAKAVIGSVAFGVFGAMQRTGIDNRFCFIDQNRDGKVETVVLVGAKREADRIPVPITPTPITLTASSKLQDPSRIVLRWVGPAGLAGTPTFGIELHENGQKRAIADSRRQVKFGGFPLRLDFFGTRFTVTGYDASAKTLTVRPEKGFAPGPFYFEAPVQTQYIYVYIPAIK